MTTQKQAEKIDQTLLRGGELRRFAKGFPRFLKLSTNQTKPQ